METSDGKIQAWQLYLLLFLSRVILLFTVDAEMMGGKNLLSLTLSAVFSMLLTFMLAAPALYAHRRWPQKNLLAIGEMAFGKMGRDLLAVLYLLFFLVADGYYLCDFGRFLQVETEYGASVWLILATVVLATLYCLKKGLQAIARTAVLLSGAMILLLLLMVPIWIPMMDSSRTLPLFYEGTDPVLRGTLSFTARSTRFAALLFLLPQVKGRVTRGFFWWNIGITASFVLFFLLISFCLGEYGASVSYPVYALLQLFSYGPFTRLDAVFTGGWIMAMIMKLAMDQLMFALCFQCCFPGAGKWWRYCGPFLVSGVTAFLFFHTGWHEKIGATAFFLTVTVLVLLIIPCLTIAGGMVREKRGAK